jgi:hypothetical protein
MYTLHQSPCLIPDTHRISPLLHPCRPGANQADVLASTRRLVEVLSKDPDPKMKVGGGDYLGLSHLIAKACSFHQAWE